MVSLVTVLKGLWAAASARRRHGDVATRRRQSGQVAGLPQNAGRPLTAPPAWCQDPLAMCACSRENNQAPNLATLLQGTASTPAVVIDSSPSPGGRGHGRAPCPGEPAAGARGRRTRPGAALWATSSPEGAGKRSGRDHSFAPGAVWRGRPTRPLSGLRNGGGTQNGPTRRAETRAGNVG